MATKQSKLANDGKKIPKKISGKTPGKKRTFGSLKGKIKMSKDFDAPLEDFADYM